MWHNILDVKVAERTRNDNREDKRERQKAHKIEQAKHKAEQRRGLSVLSKVRSCFS